MKHYSLYFGILLVVLSAGLGGCKGPEPAGEVINVPAFSLSHFMTNRFRPNR